MSIYISGTKNNLKFSRSSSLSRFLLKLFLFLYQEYHFHANLLHIHSWLSTEQCTESTDSNWRMEHYSKMFLLLQFCKSLHFLNYFENGALFKDVSATPILQILTLFQVFLRCFLAQTQKGKKEHAIIQICFCSGNFIVWSAQ